MSLRTLPSWEDLETKGIPKHQLRPAPLNHWLNVGKNVDLEKEI